MATLLVLAAAAISPASPCLAETAGPVAEPIDAEQPRAQAAPAEESPTADASVLGETAATVLTAALQGRDGVRIQTLCTHCNSSNIEVGGLSQDLVPLFRDGFPVVGGLATSFILSILPADSIAAARVVKGPGDARLPNAAAGGEIRLIGSAPRELPRIELVAEGGSDSLWRATGRAAGSLAPWISGSLVFGTTDVDRIDDDRDGWVDVPAVDRQFAEGQLTLAPADEHEIWLGGSYIDERNAEGRGAFDAFRYISEGRDSWTREDTSFDRQELRAGWRWRLAGGGTLDLRLLDARRDQRLRSHLTASTSGPVAGADRLIDRLRIREDNAWARLTHERPIGLGWRVTAGLEDSRREVDAVNIEPLNVLSGRPLQPQLARETVDMQSAHVDVGWAASSRWDFQVGLRFDEAALLTEVSHPAPTRTRRSESEISPRLTARFFPSRDWTLRLVAGRTFRPPKPMLVEVCCGQRYQTTEQVAAERGTTLGLDVVFNPTPRLRASAYVARTDFDDHVLRVVGWSQVFIQTYALANIPEARAESAELALRWRPHATLTLDGTLGWLSFENTGREVVDVIVSPPSFAGTVTVPVAIDRVPYRAERSASMAATVKLPGESVISAQASYTGSMPIQQFTRLANNSELDTETLRETPGFWLLHVSAEVPLHSRLSLLGTVNNVSDRLQNDLGDPTTDYNWGPLAGRTWQAGLKFRLGR